MKYQKFVNKKVQCLICPRKCLLNEGQQGFCKVRANINNEIKLLTYGHTTGFSLDNIEKKPLYHFLSGTKTLSFGTQGCCMGCLFCQNHHITKTDFNLNFLTNASPNTVIELTKKYNCPSISFTYNEPIIFFEYALDIAKLAHKNNIKTVMVTSGYINPNPREEIFQYIDATNIDLKGFSEQFYAKNCLAHIEPVLDTIKYVHDHTNCHIELTTLLIPNENDDKTMLEKECKWIVENVGCEVPLHFSRFFPRYKYLNYEQTPLKSLKLAYDIAKQCGIKYVYLGNI